MSTPPPVSQFHTLRLPPVVAARPTSRRLEEATDSEVMAVLDKELAAAEGSPFT
jgi:hypothetical protein